MGFTQGSATRPGPEIFDRVFFDPEKNLILNPEVPEKPGPDFKFSPKTGPDPEKLENTEIKKKVLIINFNSQRINPALWRTLVSALSALMGG